MDTPQTLPVLLLVEDDLLFAQLVRDWLEGLFTCQHVKSLKAALDALGDTDFAGIILDLNLKDSQRLLTLWRVLEVCDGTPILAVTGTPGLSARGPGYVLVEKPLIDWEQFAQTLAGMFGGSHA